jgi:hypothetical protein
MDAIFLYKKFTSPVSSAASIKEKFANFEITRKDFIAYVVIALVFGIPAAWLSYDSNSILGWNPFFKIIFAMIAFVFSLDYMLNHLVHKWDMLNYIRSSIVPRL